MAYDAVFESVRTASKKPKGDLVAIVAQPDMISEALKVVMSPFKKIP
jgi:hypothetical protein